MTRIIPLLFTLLALSLFAQASLAQSAPAQTPSPEPPAPQPLFDVLEYQVEGNSVLGVEAIERAVMPFLGPGKTIDDVEKARTALEKAYRDAGYATVFVDVPEQKVQEGIVRLAVTEGVVERVKITGSRYYALGEIRRRVPALVEGTVPFFPDAQAEVAELNRSPGRKISPILRPGRGPGTVEVELKVEDKPPLGAGLELNNRASPGTKPLRMGAYVRYDNLFQADHSLTLNAIVSPQEYKDARAYSASYLAPLSGGRYLAAYAVWSRSAVAAIGTVNVVGSGDLYGLRWIQPLDARPGMFQSMTLGIDYKDFLESVNVAGADTLTTPITYAPLSLQYSLTVEDGPSTIQLENGFTAGVDGLLGTRDSQFQQKRSEAHSSFIYMRGDLAYTRPLRSWEVYLRGDWQLADQPLISNEQFVAGGAESVRGYREAEVAGDNAVRGRLELRTPLLPGLGPVSLKPSRAYLFAEAAALTLRDPLPEQHSRFYVSSAGLGFRAAGTAGWLANLDFALPLRSTPYTGRGQPRLLFRLAYDF